jgi:hypothetical protein
MHQCEQEQALTPQVARPSSKMDACGNAPGQYALNDQRCCLLGQLVENSSMHPALTDSHVTPSFESNLEEDLFSLILPVYTYPSECCLTKSFHSIRLCLL